MLIHAIRFLRAWTTCTQILQQLSRLSDSDLRKLGISRSDIPRIAWERSEV